MSSSTGAICSIAALAVIALAGAVQAQRAANLTGTYRCEAQPSPCQWPDHEMSIVQSGDVLELKSRQGPVGEAKLTSDITATALPPWNAIGIIHPDLSIQWSNGTLWRRQ
jgi:hypothetical protein